MGSFSDYFWKTYRETKGKQKRLEKKEIKYYYGIRYIGQSLQTFNK